MSQPQAGVCRSCGKRVLWVRTAAGKSMPLDPEPTPDGNLLLTEATVISRNGLAKDHPGPFHFSHFSSCPEACRWRKKPTAPARGPAEGDGDA